MTRAVRARFDEGKPAETIPVLSSRPDPLNPKVFGGRSAVEMPEAPDPEAEKSEF